ncbi:MAG: GNAT family N-acetyltransferase [Sphingobacteriia bacterium]|nr:GNAT family N-acetyltransferase [Sphingobacteriia bacterium]
MEITQSTNTNDFKECAAIMANTDPWITLKRNYEQCLQAFEGNFREVFVAKEKGVLLGFIILQMQGTFKGYIQTVAVAENARDKGIGSQLIGFAEEKILRTSPNIFICVSLFNHQAQKLYKRLGYEEVGILKDFIVNGFDEILMRKSFGSLSGL